MNYMRIHIIGGAGSGKSYVAARLSDMYGMAVLDLDTIFWDNTADGYNKRADGERRDRALAAFITRESWIVEGVYHTWLEPSFRAADAIIILTTPRWLRHYRIMRRFVARKVGMAPSKRGETLRSLWELLKWNHAYDRDNLVRAKAMICDLGLEPAECRDAGAAMRVLAPRGDSVTGRWA